MAEQQQQPQEQQQEQQYYGAFTTADGYSVPGGLFHPPTIAAPQIGLAMPGQSFVGPPMGDGQPIFQMGGAPAFAAAAPLQIGIPGGFHFAPEYSDPPESAMVSTPGYNSQQDHFSVITRGAELADKKPQKQKKFSCPWCSNN